MLDNAVPLVIAVQQPLSRMKDEMSPALVTHKLVLLRVLTAKGCKHTISVSRSFRPSSIMSKRVEPEDAWKADVALVPIKQKYRTSTGDKHVMAIVWKKHKGKKYEILTHAGRIETFYTRNEMQFEHTISETFLMIPPQLEELPPISEIDALNLTNPMRKLGIHCSCKKVRVPPFPPLC